MPKITKRKKSQSQNQSQNGDQGQGVLDLVWLDPKELSDHPDNWNLHPERQVSAIGASIDANTFFNPILYNLETNRIVGGHGRKKAAIRKKLSLVPVVRGRWTKEQELRILRDDNVLSRMSEVDPNALDALNERINRASESVKNASQRTKLDLERLQKDTKDLASQISGGIIPATFEPSEDRRVRPTNKERTILDKEREDDRGDVIKVSINEDAIFESSNKFGIPDLRSDMLAPEGPVGTYARQADLSDEGNLWYCISAKPFPKPDQRSGGTLGFFTEDYRFQRCYERPSDFYGENIVEADWTAVVEPDFSIYGNYPVVLKLYHLYKNRWCARFWQELDIPIIPQICIITDWNKKSLFTAKMVYETLPKDIPVMAAQCRPLINLDSGNHWINFFRSLDLACNILNIGTIILYGGPESEKRFKDELPKGPNYVLIDSYITSRRNTFTSGES